MKIDTSPNSSTDHVPDVTEDAGDLQSLSHPVSAQDQRTREQNRRLRWLAAALALTSVVLVIIVLSQIRRVQQAQDFAQVIQSTAMSEANVRTTAQAEARMWQAEAEAAESTIEVLRTEVENDKSTAETTEATAEALRTEVEDPQATEGPEQQAQIALARHLTLQAHHILDNLTAESPRALLLAVESLRRYPESAAAQVVADSMVQSPQISVVEAMGIAGYDLTFVMAFSPDARRIIVTACNEKDGGSFCVGGLADIWEVPTMRKVSQIRHEAWVTAVSFSPDGQRVVTGGFDGTARVWDANTGREISRMTHKGGVNAVSFSPDGQWVVSGGSDGIARVWDANTGREISRTVHGHEVYSAVFSPDGQ